MKQSIISGAVLCMGLWFCTSCNSDKVKVGVAMDILDGRWAKDREFIREKVAEMGGEAIFTVANNDAAQQALQVRQLIEQEGIDVLLIVPTNSAKAVDLVALAKKDGVKVIAYDRLINNADLDAYVSFDNVQVGRMQSEYLLSKVPTGNYLLLGGSPTDNNAKLFREGQIQGLKTAVADAKVQVIGNGWADNWSPQFAYEQTLQLLNEGKQIDAIIASNDRLATGAVKALTEKGVSYPVAIAGQDADAEACRRIAEGTQAMTVYKPVKDLAYSAAVAAVMLAEDKDVPNLNAKQNNGKKEVPSVLLSPVRVDEHNLIQTVIADDFLTKQAVYGETGRPRKRE
ncbi:D-xylose transport system substrate-binding protein [Flexibacter flexilis DSM 6793]|uniref:D-xylose transport system substrate-binding protein n=1 Tax=Flexibacter flexilis DSM 6793 TaxID=927664 RepID=A0A1I1DLS8_9BACT|nr:substrate-binding domain-containing protein [Flexibacter flexilis]SFB75807.1 D-xylose transport system substrate-binding protein [Flexibacter flexilis DSM 6793]